MKMSVLSVGGVEIGLNTDQSLIEDEAFLPFITESKKADICVTVTAVDEILPIPEKVVYRAKQTLYAQDNRGTLYRFFFQTEEDAIPHVVTFFDENDVLQVNCRKDKISHFFHMHDAFRYLGIEDLLLRKDRICLHAACVQTPLGGILFSGPSGIGKSTQADLWCRYRNGRLINGDRPILSGAEGKWLAWGSPYAGSSRCYVNESCPITAIVMLEQGRDCACRRLTKGEAFRAVWSGVTVHDWDPQFALRAMDLVTELIETVPVFRLRCTVGEESVDFLEKALREEC